MITLLTITCLALIAFTIYIYLKIVEILDLIDLLFCFDRNKDRVLIYQNDRLKELEELSKPKQDEKETSK